MKRFVINVCQEGIYLYPAGIVDGLLTEYRNRTQKYECGDERGFFH
ncbi:MAG: hypothetical protein KBG33_03955 [Paludibacteraceae bacterium]|nr:hypothetical protein [Paludibacteraceae bacterium]